MGHSTVAGPFFSKSRLNLLSYVEICHEFLLLRHLTRYVAAHGLKHKEKTKTHSVCMETKQLSVFCYDCDEFVINDTSDK